MNGFCITYLGKSSSIHMGCYKNNIKNGNWVSYEGGDLQIVQSGRYRDGQRVGKIKYRATCTD